MHIAFDISQAGAQKAGCGYLAYSLAHELLRSGASELTLLRTFGTDWWDPDNANIMIDGDDSAHVKYAASFFSQPECATFWNQSGRQIEQALGRPQIIHSNNFYAPSIMPYTKQVYTLHDMAVFECPQYTTEANRVVCTRGILRAASTADFIVANSEFTRSNFLEYFPFPEERVVTFSLGSRFDDDGTVGLRPSVIDSKAKFILCVGTIEPRKNFVAVLESFQKIADKTDAILVFAGKVGWMMDDFPAIIAATGLKDRVKVLSYVSDAELRWLFENCSLFAYPSFWEGFGMPVLEAMSLGAPIITSTKTSLPEVCGDAGLKFPPEAIGDIATGMMRLLEDKAFNAAQRQISRERAQAYSWQKGTAKLMDVYEELARESRAENQFLGKAFRRDIQRRFSSFYSSKDTRRYVLDVTKAIFTNPAVRRKAMDRATDIAKLAFWPK
jgi:glycosyltransferase involved in cell wall biosynthesis